MADTDLTEVQATESVKIVGSNATGTEQTPVASTTAGGLHANLRDSSGNEINSALDVAGKRNILASMTHNIYVSNSNSSTANLGAGATFTGTSENNLNASAIQVCIKADQPVTIQLQQSNDNTNWDFVTSYYLAAGNEDARYIIAAGSYARVLVTNDGTGSTTYFNLQTIFVPFSSVLPTSLTNDGQLKVSIEEVSPELDNILTADKGVYGSTVVSSRVKLLTGDFSLPINNNDVSSTTSGGGTVTSSNSMAVIASGTATTASAKLFSNQNNKHYSGRESYVQFGAAFTAPTSAASEQRVGLYDANNGFFLGYHGLTFGVTVRKNGVDTFTSNTSFSEDLLDGNPNSVFQRNGVAEAINPTKLNKFRIKYGFGGNLTIFEVLSPDGGWVEFHEIKNGNLQTTPSILNPNVPFTAEVTKTSSDATNLSIIVPSFDAGTLENANAFGIEDINGRKYTTAISSQQTTSGTVYTVSTGRTLRITTLDISCANALLSGNGQLNIRDGSSGTIIYTMTIPSSTNQSSAGSNKTLTFPVPLRFTMSVYAQVVSGTLTYSVFFAGYEAEN